MEAADNTSSCVLDLILLPVNHVVLHCRLMTRQGRSLFLLRCTTPFHAAVVVQCQQHPLSAAGEDWPCCMRTVVSCCVAQPLILLCCRGSFFCCAAVLASPAGCRRRPAPLLPCWRTCFAAQSLMISNAAAVPHVLQRRHHPLGAEEDWPCCCHCG
jgi:hypothetical protein